MNKARSTEKHGALRIILFLTVLGMAILPSLARGEGKVPSWWPQEYTVIKDEAGGRLTLKTAYYTFQHDLKRGGALSLINLTHGRADSLILKPMESRVRLALSEKMDASGTASRVSDTFSDLYDPSPEVSIDEDGKTVTVTVRARLLDRDGKDSSLRIRTEYRYRWGYVKIHKEFSRAGNPVRIRFLNILNTVLDPSLTDYGYRPGVVEEMGPNTHSWQTGQIRRWGKLRPGTHLDLPFQTRHMPRYLVFLNQGIEGLEWFVSDDLSQWDFQITEQPGDGFCQASATFDPLGIALSLYPLNLSQSFNLPKGGSVEFKNPVVFDYYFAIPILAGHANKPWLHESIRGVRHTDGSKVTSDSLRNWAESGIREITLHDDGDRFRDGQFWRDGSYPPYPPDVMKTMDALIEDVHANGIRIAPYFSNHELHQSTEAFQKFGEEWGRKPDDQGNLRPNYYYGAHMCLKSGWLDFFKFSVDRVLKNHDFDGIYYDWNIAMFCNNPLHVGQTDTGVSGDRGLGSYAISPTGHWDIDELIDLAEWTRERVGPDGLVIFHNTLVPMFVTENFADHVVGLEFSYNKLYISVPDLDEFPPEWSFAGARTRAAIVSGTVHREAPPRTYRLHALAGLMTSVTPWRANADSIEFVGRLKPLGDIEQYRFEDWRNTAVILNNDNCVSAVYSRPGESFILLANFNPESRQVNCRLDPANLPYPLAAPASAEALDGIEKKTLDVGSLLDGGAQIEVPADNVIIIRIR